MGHLQPNEGDESFRRKMSRHDVGGFIVVLCAAAITTNSIISQTMLEQTIIRVLWIALDESSRFKGMWDFFG